MTKKMIKQIPYGIANYNLMIGQNCYYVDKTMYLRTIEEAGNYLVFIRPRRFGKSLFLSVIEAYYDVFYKERFDELFKGTSIFSDPTAERGIYLVLSFNFSAVDPAPDKVEASFLNHVRGRALSFLSKYPEHLIKDLEYAKRTIEESRSSVDILSTIIDVCKDSNRKLYIIIDEYDNFTNTVLSTAGEKVYESLTHGEGFFKSFFNVLKVGTTGADAPINRLFITGVSPITLDDVTSGFNIGENISIDSAFNRMLGFTENDVRMMVDYYKSAGLIKHDAEYIMEILDRWYGGYLFSRHSGLDDRMYNSDMVLYFLKEYFKNKTIPDDLIDENVKIDYKKLRHLIIIDSAKGKTSNGNFSRLKQVMEKGEVWSKLVKSFSLKKLVHKDNFTTLLYYFGLLTVKNIELDDTLFEIPNETIQRLYYDYIKEGYEETDVFTIDLSVYGHLMKNLALKGEWKPLFEYIAGRMKESMSLRDLIVGEKSIQAFLNVYLGLSQLYIVHVEKEMNKGYADIVMEPFLSRYEEIKYSYLIEIKYTKSGSKPGDADLKQLKSEAEEQLKRYGFDEKFRKVIEKTTLIKIVLIFSGHELMVSIQYSATH